MPPKKAQTNICHACTMAGRADCDAVAAWAAGRNACSYCERVRAEQIKHGARRLRECHPTTTTFDDVAAAQSQSAPGLAGQQGGGYGGGWGFQRAPGPAGQQGGGYGGGWGFQRAPGPADQQSGGYGGGLGNRRHRKPQGQGYSGGHVSLTINQPPVAEQKKRKRSDDGDDDDGDDYLDRQIREAKKMKIEQDKRRQLRELQQDLQRGEEEERAREEEWARHQETRREEADRHEALARQRQRDAYDEERRINEPYREENRRGWDRGRSRSPISRSESQQAVRPRSPAPDPNSMVDWERRSKNVQSQLWILNQRIDRERRAHEIQARATRQTTDAVASGGDVNMSPPPTGPRPGGRSRQRQDLREQRERWSRE
ncbi:hypothetical protein KC333_g1066 [Hortaea werneckii]|nr:hypothetical protein KC333_g1066 [Hortaea werneckii]KAI7301566.1 hypothetical protein KC326_g9136 [Hortaea werneckii]